MSYSGLHYLPTVWKSESGEYPVELRVADESDSHAVTLNIRRADGREVDLSIELDEASVHDEWEFPAEGRPVTELTALAKKILTEHKPEALS